MKILLVDDHAVVRQGYSALIKMMIADCEVDEAETVADAKRLVYANRYDLAVLDINLQEGSGLQLAPRWVAEFPVIFFSMFDDVAMVRRALQTGAQGYISKRCKPEEMLAAIKTVLAGDIFIEPRLQCELDTLADSECGLLESLAPREFDIFMAVASGKTRQHVANELNISAKTVSNTLTQIKAKLGVNTSSEIVRLAIENGLLEERSK